MQSIAGIHSLIVKFRTVNRLRSKNRDRTMQIVTIELVEDRQGVTLTTYVPDNSPERLNGSKRPAVLVCPGGYIRCSDREARPVALRFVAMGYQAFVLRYSTYSGGKPENSRVATRSRCRRDQVDRPGRSVAPETLLV
jgi:acetyl esterase/lipase